MGKEKQRPHPDAVRGLLRAERPDVHALGLRVFKSAAASDRAWCIAVFACALVLRLIYLYQIEAIPLFYHLAGDGLAYDEWARRIAAGDWIGDGVFYQAPLYPYFLGLLQLALGHDLGAIRFVQVLMGALSCAVLFLAGRRLFSRSAAVVAGMLLAIYAPAIFFDALIEKSVLDLLLLSFLLFLLARSMEEQRRNLWITMGAVAGLLALSRENALILVLVVPAWIGLFFASTSAGARLRWCALFLAGLLLVLLPVGLRNFAAGGEFKLTTSQFGANFFIGNNPAADGTYGSVRKLLGEPQLEGRDAVRLAERAMGRNLNAGEVSDYWFDRAVDYIRGHPLDWLRLLGRKWLMVWNAREIEDSDDFYIYQQWSPLLRFLGWFSHFGLLAPLAVAGAWLTLRHWRRLAVLYAVALSLAASVALFFVFGRYRYPLVPVLALFAGAALVESAALWRQGLWRRFGAALAVFLVAAVPVNWPIRGVRGPGPGGYNNLANAYYKQGRVDEAIETARKAIAADPGYGTGHYNLGNFYAAQGRLNLAFEHVEKAVALYPNHAEGRRNLGWLLIERGDIEAGIRELRRAVELDPSLAEAHLNLGVALARQGHMDEAVQALQRAILLDDSAEAHHALGLVYGAREQYEAAAGEFRKALELDPGFVAARRDLEEVLAVLGRTEETPRRDRKARGAPNGGVPR
ncbi:MAG TPA: tetratricopeptide repeat protein [candidate division Zixibacteria bacterium]|nr:tetratricopeptide repeat protein [candidate division Zixibacteria bacterium]